ncbi:17-beta-hydroxysteroid dehydrogenase type 6-like [Aplysia californica]|uniref:17-beta-hydroxysteroid dehydrogenase type 6-like n=1 Tax=Aplysia californica TaxID=6500 RepID=A0ABM0JJ31_APLCA|nr:17-beta-hydroxysteroid dehydrogenase type 6-like [Aplysia californica]
MDLFSTILGAALLLCGVIATGLLVLKYKSRKKMLLPTFKSVLVTGCDRGFGFMLAKRLDEEGFKVFAGCLDATGEGAKELQMDTSPKLELIQLDVTKEKEIEEAKAKIIDSLAGYMLWAVVNNAGVACHAEFEWIPKRSFQHTIDVNILAVVNVTRAFLPLVRAAKGRIVNMASMAGRTATPGFTAYSASKFAVIGFSESLRREMAHFGVKVITVEPAIYKYVQLSVRDFQIDYSVTALSSTTNFLGQCEEFWAQAEPGIKRDYGEPYFLATQEAKSRLLQWTSPALDEVVDCYMHAVASVQPHSRYVPPWKLQLLNDVMNMLWNSVQDRILAAVMNIRAKPDMLRPIQNGRTGRRRSHAT